MKTYNQCNHHFWFATMRKMSEIIGEGGLNQVCHGDITKAECDNIQEIQKTELRIIYSENDYNSAFANVRFIIVN